MKYNSSKKAAVISAVVIAVVALVFCWLYVSRDYDSPWLFFASDYTKKLYSEDPPYSLQGYLESRAGYLCSEDTEFTVDNFNQIIEDCFSAPMRLLYSAGMGFYKADADMAERLGDEYAYQIIRKCDDIEANRNFIEVFRGITVTPCATHYTDEMQYPKQERMGCVVDRVCVVDGVYVGRGYAFEIYLTPQDDGTTVITFSRCTLMGDVESPYISFVTDAPLLERYEKVVKKMERFSMELTSPDEVPH